MGTNSVTPFAREFTLVCFASLHGNWNDNGKLGVGPSTVGLIAKNVLEVVSDCDDVRKGRK